MSRWNWTLTDDDLTKAREFAQTEVLRPLTSETMFRGGLYCILSARELYDNQIRLMKRLIHHKVASPDSIKADQEKVRKILGKWKSPLVIEFAEFWPESGLEQRILADVNNGHDEEFAIREDLARKCPGMAYKCASLFLKLCGYQRVVPIDIWMLRFLSSKENKKAELILAEYYKTKRGLTRKTYLELEQEFAKYAAKHKLTPSEFHVALWCKNSSYEPNRQLNLPNVVEEAKVL